MPRPRKKVVEEESIVTPVMDVIEAVAPVIQSRRLSTGAFILLLGGLAVVIVGGAFLIGRADHGQIDVNAAIQKSNQEVQARGGDQSAIVNTTQDELRRLPNGGLVPTTNSPQQQPAADTQGSSTTTSTNASSTPTNSGSTTASTTEATKSQAKH